MHHANPDFWTLENPKGHLRQRPFMHPLKDCMHLTSYCKFGRAFRKDANTWTNVPVELPVCRLGSYCDGKQQHGRHLLVAEQDSPKLRNGDGAGAAVTVDMLYSIPHRLCSLILRAALDSRPPSR
jgi:hypothetical protein